MSKTVEGSSVAGPQDATGSNVVTFEDLVQERAGQLSEGVVDEHEEPDTVTEGDDIQIEDESEESVQAEAEDEEESLSEESESVLSQLNLTDEEKEQLRKELQPGAEERIGELTRKRKEAEEELARLRSEMSKKNPLEREEESEDANNPFKDVQNMQDLADKMQNFEAVREWADDVLFENDHADPDDVIVTYDGKEYTKKEVRKHLKNAEKNIKHWIPQRARSLQQAEQAKAVDGQLLQSLNNELIWFKDEENEIRKIYDQSLQDPIMQKVIKAVPEIKGRLEYMVAHTLNSRAILSNQSGSAKNGSQANAPVKKQSATPPPNPSSSAGSKAIRKRGMSKALEEAEARFDESNSVEDWIKYRTLQLS